MIALSLLTSPFSHCRSTPLLPVPYPPCYHRCCPTLELVCFHPRKTPHILSVSPLSVLLSGPPASIISPSIQYLFLPSINATFAIFYPYNYTHPLPLYLTHLYFYLSIYFLSLTLSILSLSLNIFHYIFPQSLSLPDSYSLSHFLLLKSPFSHYLTLYLTHTLSNSLFLLQSLRLPHLHYDLRKTRSQR